MSLVIHLGLAYSAFGLFYYFWGCHLCVVFFLLSYFADVFNSSMWTNFREAVAQNDAALSSLAESLHGVVLASRAPSTSAKYIASYNQ